MHCTAGIFSCGVFRIRGRRIKLIKAFQTVESIVCNHIEAYEAVAQVLIVFSYTKFYAEAEKIRTGKQPVQKIAVFGHIVERSHRFSNRHQRVHT